MSHVEALFMSDWHCWVKQWLTLAGENNAEGESLSPAPGLWSLLCTSVSPPRPYRPLYFSVWTTQRPYNLLPCLTAPRWTYLNIEGPFSPSSQNSIYLYLPAPFSSAVTIETLTSLSARRLWLPGSLALSGERHWWASVSLARLRHRCSKRGIYLALTVFPWQPAPHCRWHVDPFCHFGLTAETEWNPVGRDPLL